MPESVEHKGTHTTEPQRPLVLFLNRGRLHVSACRCRRPTQPSDGLFATSQRRSRSARTRGLKGSIRRAAAVLPCVTCSVPYCPFDQPIDSQRRREFSSGRIPVSISTVAMSAMSSPAAPRYRASSSGNTTRSR
jgi:hypothetical protein